MLTELEALKLTRDQWSIIAAEGVGKSAALQRMWLQRVEGRMDPSHDCFCCEFVRAAFGIPHDGGMACSVGSSNDITARSRAKAMLAKCPLRSLWPNGCEQNDSPFALWVDERGNKRHEQAKHHATTIVAECDRLIGELEASSGTKDPDVVQRPT